jgi:hypothetical protein
MEDTSTGRVQKGKFTVGGHPDASAVSRYAQEVHISPVGTALDPIGTASGFGTLTFVAGSPNGTITRSAGSWTTDLFAVGDYIQISATTSNNGVFGPIISITGGGTILTVQNGYVAIAAESTAVATIISKNFQYPIGTREDPAANLLDANLIALVLNIQTYHLRGGMTMTVNFDHFNWVFFGDDPDADIITFSSPASSSGCVFTTLGIRGTLNGRITTTRCVIGAFLGTVDGLEGIINDTGLAGTIKIANAGVVSGLQVAARDLNGSIIDFTNGGSGISWLVGSMYGLLSVVNMGVATAVFGIAAQGAVISIDSTCSQGTVQVGGVGELNVDNGVTATIINQLVRGTLLDEHVSDIVAFVA